MTDEVSDLSQLEAEEAKAAAELKEATEAVEAFGKTQISNKALASVLAELAPIFLERYRAEKAANHDRVNKQLQRSRIQAQKAALAEQQKKLDAALQQLK